MKTTLFAAPVVGLMSTAALPNAWHSAPTCYFVGNYHTQPQGVGNQVHQFILAIGTENGAYNAWKFGNDMKLNLS